MGPEFWVGLAAVFVSGGAVGAVGTLLAQWLVRRVAGDGPPVPPPSDPDLRLLRAEVLELTRQFENLDARLDFQEQLLGGATPTTQPPPRLPPEGGDAGT